MKHNQSSLALVPVAAALVPTAASTSDAILVDLWLNDKGPLTQRAYRYEVERFLGYVACPLAAVTLGQVQGYRGFLDSLSLAPATKKRALAAVKSLYGWAQRLGYLQFDTARPVKLPGLRDTLAERILTAQEVERIVRAEPDPRNSVLIRLLFYGGVRVSEACGLRWRDVKERGTGILISVFGKGQKSRTVPIEQAHFIRDLKALRQGAPLAAPVFVSRNQKGALSSVQAWRIVKAAAQRAGIETAVGPHHFRHTHATLALEAGEPIQLVQRTLGHASIETTGRYLHVRPNETSGRQLPDF